MGESYPTRIAMGSRLRHYSSLTTTRRMLKYAQSSRTAILTTVSALRATSSGSLRIPASITILPWQNITTSAPGLILPGALKGT